MTATARSIRGLPHRRLVTAGIVSLALCSSGGLAQENVTPEGGAQIVRPATILIDSAELGNGANPCDVTSTIRARCEKRQTCDLVVNKDLCPYKRLPGLIQTLKISYRCRAGEILRTVTGDEPDRLRLLCAPSLVRPD